MKRRKPKIRRLLVANRGEIALRIMRTCRDMGIETVAVFSEADRLAPHVLYADYAVCVGPAPSAQSYLVHEKILDACRQTGADAIHPGYGFLSENAGFARACSQAGITFVGPSPLSMELMGSKTKARQTVSKAGTPVVPGNNGPNGNGFPTAQSALKAAKDIRFPVLIKAAAGGGGKGMRLVEKAADFKSAFDGAKREAKSSFGDDTVYIEKAIIDPRHVEIQVFADTFGNVVHLGERDCSIQRRHQKVVEEAPSPAVSQSLRNQMGDAAIAAARSCNYVGAGTVEFLLAPNGEFYFLEMNTRLQVEHPVTEMIYAVDLVKWQLEIAMGKKLPFTQEALDGRRHGWAMECRVYAEDSVRFMPSPGLIQEMKEPGGPYVRNDAGAYENYRVPMHYDPMISKLITWGEDRQTALVRMERALSEYSITGIETNIPFHKALLSHPKFRSGEFTIQFIEQHYEELMDRLPTPPEKWVAAAAAVQTTERTPNISRQSK